MQSSRIIDNVKYYSQSQLKALMAENRALKRDLKYVSRGNFFIDVLEKGANEKFMKGIFRAMDVNPTTARLRIAKFVRTAMRSGSEGGIPEGLNPRVLNLIKSEFGIKTLGQLSELTEGEIMSIKGIDVIGVEETKIYLGIFGLNLKGLT